MNKVDILFFSAFDHNEGHDSHGLFEMFKFFKNNLKYTSTYVNTMNSLYKNNIDVFDISGLGNNTHLFNQITNSNYRENNPYSWKSLIKDKYKFIAAQVLIKVLPKHKFFVLIDRADIDFEILEIILKHFKSKLLIISAVNNTWTGHCSYPAEFKCGLFKTQNGCDETCPALNNRLNPKIVRETFDSTRKFLKNNSASVLLNVGNRFSLNEATDSYLFKDIKKSLIPLKNLECEENFQKLTKFKEKNRSNIVKEFNNIVKEDDILIMWSAYYIETKRKGFDFLMSALRNLKIDNPTSFEKVCLVICCNSIGSKYTSMLKELNVKYIFAGFLKRKQYNFFASGCDFYCCTTVSDAGPRTTYESAAMATPVISFDNCNSLDFVNSINGALIETYNIEQLANEINRLVKINKKQYAHMSKNIHDSYMRIMDTDTLISKWETFFDEN